MNFLNDLSGYELVTLATVISIYLSQGLTPNEIDTLGNFFSALGSNLSTIATAQANSPDSVPPSLSN